MVICLGWPSPATSSSLPAASLTRKWLGIIGVGHTSPPIWPCSGWGLPCHRCYQRRGGLLPHRFTLTLCSGEPELGRFLFCGPFRRLTTPRRYLAAYPVELGLSSDTSRYPRPSCSTSRKNIAGNRGGGEVGCEVKCIESLHFAALTAFRLPASPLPCFPASLLPRFPASPPHLPSMAYPGQASLCLLHIG